MSKEVKSHQQNVSPLLREEKFQLPTVEKVRKLKDGELEPLDTAGPCWRSVRGTNTYHTGSILRYS